jgi:prepilin-type N-terminal cleavage/methylation domain-containing protein
MMKRRGFTLIELMVALAILLVLTSMAFSSFSIILAASKSNQNREAVLEDMSTVLDQLTKELRQTVTVGSFANVGVQYPAAGGTRGVTDISTLNPPYYVFGTNDPGATSPINNPILTFYTLDDTGVEHRISYSLGVPTDGSGYVPPHYKGIAQQYWASQSHEPCQVWYSNETGTGWTSGVYNQPVTGQVITNFTVIRPAWSDKVIQIVLEAMAKDSSGKAVTITRIALIPLRQ